MATILIAEARFYPHINDMLLEGARVAIESAGHKHETLTVPGALELPGGIALAARSGRFCAFVALGVVIRGETYHFEVVSEESARGLVDLTLQGFAIGNGILTVENEEQAIARADPKQGDKGGGAARAALALYDLREQYAP
ncbi:MAG: 6,7-dimethyl-8-ribityllumazine synthase [Sphingomicrobium sp.]